MNSLYRKVSSGKFLDALNARDVKEMQKFSNHDMSVLQSALNIYEQLDRLL